MAMKPQVIFTLIGIALIGGVVVLSIFFIFEKRAVSAITSFEECAQNGFLVLESSPRQCRTPDGRIFIETISVAEQPTQNPVFVNSIKAGATVTSPLTVSGEAQGNWFFEASFPVVLKNEIGKTIATGIAQAEGDWMTTDFVPFSTILEFKNLKTQKGNLVFVKDNPSGLPEYGGEFIIPVIIEISK